MNNEQFRKLMLPNSVPSKSKNDSPPPSTKPVGGSALGSRQRSSIPMTPRSVGGSQADFARQLVERNQAGRPQKKFKTSAPKGVKLGDGYVDRAQNREDIQDGDDRSERLKALEESYKEEKIDQETYEKLRFQIAGGDLDSTHLVKGLDFKLLERIRKGEDVYSKQISDAPGRGAADEGGDEHNVDDAFDELESHEVRAIAKDRAEKKKGQLSTVAAGKKRTRDQILADLKAARAAAKAQAELSLGHRFRKIGTTQKLGTRIEKDSKGREVLIIVDADGHEKRKVRRLKPGEEEEAKDELPPPDKNAKPLGMEVPEQYRPLEQSTAIEEEEEGDVNIFDDVGDDYDPLAGMGDSDSGSEDDPKTKTRPNEDEQASKGGKDVSEHMLPPPKPQTGSRNYFKDSKTGLISEEAARGPAMSDPAIMAAIKKAATLRHIETEDDVESRKDAKQAEEKRKKLLQMAARDDDDLDMGFGTSRYEDEEDLEDQKLSSWGGGDAGGSRGEKSQRKRGPKKRKGDANNAADVLRVMEQRKKS
ncbi:hypothetical protein QQS21_009453 [Conoideocrella luteorostrata]|uniref:RED-like N-terminal domain-containing protein n=1 Tax=Conoideocrella luteorostrata TaxID=1105319 RepID=A0AAJ0CGW4_9HYPO|nr:hypothetical protein QQS21_009453 [Conoideocrella luteorostrata]